MKLVLGTEGHDEPPAGSCAGTGVRGRSPDYPGGMSLATFVLRYLPPLPARVLEIGCGPVGDLTSAIAAAGYDIIAVDPVAPEGPRFRRIPFEDFTDPGPFDAVVASLAMHHMADLTRTAAAIVDLLVPGGGSFWKSGIASACSMRRRRAGISTNGTPPRPRVYAPHMRHYLLAMRRGAAPGWPTMAICMATRRCVTSSWRRSRNDSSPGGRTSPATRSTSASNRWSER